MILHCSQAQQSRHLVRHMTDSRFDLETFTLYMLRWPISQHEEIGVLMAYVHVDMILRYLYAVVKLGEGRSRSPLPHLRFEIPNLGRQTPHLILDPPHFTRRSLGYCACLNAPFDLWNALRLFETFPRVWQTYSLVVSNLGIHHLWLGNLTTACMYQ